MHVSRRARAIKLGQLLDVQGSETQADRGGRGRRHRGRRQDRRPAHRHDAGRPGDAADRSFPRRWSAWPSRPRAAATKPSSRRAAQDRRGRRHVPASTAMPQTKELVMTGMSELHLQMIRERLKRRDKVEVDTKEPKIPYRETIQAKAEGSYRHKKQSGGRGQFGEVHIRMYPVPAGHQSRRILHARRASRRCGSFTTTRSTTSCGSIRSSAARFPTTSCRPSKRAFKERLERGVIAGYQVQNVARRGPLRQVSRRRQLGSRLQDGRLDGLPQRVSGSQARRCWSRSSSCTSPCPSAKRGRHQQRHVGPRRPRAGHGLGRRRLANRHAPKCRCAK